VRPGDPVGPYVLETRLGSGFTGETWIAQRADAPGGGAVVLKILDLREAPGWTGIDLFRREAAALGGLDHPGLPRFLGSLEIEEAGRLLLVLAMERIEGEDLRSLVASGRRFSDAEIESTLAGIAEILAYLGSLRPPVVHRDVNPKNVILRPDGRIALVDFSGVQDALRSAASPGATLVGTAGYTPVEQVAGRATPRSDLYGAAATALFLLARRNPAELPARGLKPDLSAFPGLSPRLAFVLGSWLEPDEARRGVSAARGAAILRGEEEPPRAGEMAELEGRGLPRAGTPAGALGLPSDSRVLIESSPERLRILVPPARASANPTALAGGSFVAFWLGFVAIWTVMSIRMGAPIFFTMFSLPFWIVGITLGGFMIKRALGSEELVLDRAEGISYTEILLGRRRSRIWPLSDAGACAITDSTVQIKGKRDREMSLEAGARGLRMGRGLSERELAAMRDAVRSWLDAARRDGA